MRSEKMTEKQLVTHWEDVVARAKVECDHIAASLEEVGYDRFGPEYVDKIKQAFAECRDIFTYHEGKVEEL
jgi:hypothetical protein